MAEMRASGGTTYHNEDTHDNNGDPPQAVLTVAETCERLRISKTKFYDLKRAKELETMKIGRLTRVPIDSITKYINEQRDAEKGR